MGNALSKTSNAGAAAARRHVPSPGGMTQFGAPNNKSLPNPSANSMMRRPVEDLDLEEKYAENLHRLGQVNIQKPSMRMGQVGFVLALLAAPQITQNTMHSILKSRSQASSDQQIPIDISLISSVLENDQIDKPEKYKRLDPELRRRISELSDFIAVPVAQSVTDVKRKSVDDAKPS